MLKNGNKIPSKLVGFVGFVPNRLELPDRPDLARFPFNIFIGRYTVREGKNVFGNVVYEPDFASLDQGEAESSLDYRNPYDETSFIKIIIRSEKYEAKKFFRGKEVSSADGVVRGLNDDEGWKMFFMHVAFIGFIQGETVRYDPR